MAGPSDVHRRRLLLRAKRLGLLMRDARLAAGRSLKETAAATGTKSHSSGW